MARAPWRGPSGRREAASAARSAANSGVLGLAMGRFGVAVVVVSGVTVAAMAAVVTGMPCVDMLRPGMLRPGMLAPGVLAMNLGGMVVTHRLGVSRASMLAVPVIVMPMGFVRGIAMSRMVVVRRWLAMSCMVVVTVRLGGRLMMLFVGGEGHHGRAGRRAAGCGDHRIDRRLGLVAVRALIGRSGVVLVAAIVCLLYTSPSPRD